MITRIESIANMGQFSTFKWDNASTDDFARFNLFYGWNGSGKSTLSRSLELLARQQAREGSPAIRVQHDGATVDGPSATPLGRLYVFNDEFVADNIDWNEKAKSILFVSQEKIADRTRLDDIDSKLEQMRAEHKTLKDKLDKDKRDHEKYLSQQASVVKNQFLQIDTNDSKYLYYDKRNIRDVLDKDEAKELSAEQVSELLQVTRARDMAQIGTITRPTVDAIPKLLEDVDRLRGQTVTAQVIERLKANPQLNAWVKQGLQLHSEIETCEFCGSDLKSARLDELNAHFNDQYEGFLRQGQVLKQRVAAAAVTMDLSPRDVFEPCKKDYLEALAKLGDAVGRVAPMLDQITKALDEKLQNPFASMDACGIDTSPVLTQLQRDIESLNEAVTRHNNMANELSKRQTDAKRALELAFVHAATIGYDYQDRMLDFQKQADELKALEDRAKPLKAERKAIQDSLSNESIAASAFNLELSRFLGHREIEMSFDQQEGGYRIIRTRDGSPALKLSEGEKNAIALIYFSIKTKENGNPADQTIVAIDDPVSSLDSHFTFHAYAFIKAHFEGCKQLFVLSHNFAFFKLMHDWLSGKNKKDKPAKSRFYVVSADGTGESRRSIFRNADDSLRNYSSEYHYAFGRLVAFSKKADLTHDEWMLSGNLARKCLECFASFKHPKKRNDFSQLLDQIVDDTVTRNRVYKFINHFSHLNTIHFDQQHTDMMLAEGTQAIRDVLKIIHGCDPTHCQELFEVLEVDLPDWLQAEAAVPEDGS